MTTPGLSGVTPKTPGHPGRSSDPSLTSGSDSGPLPDIQDGFRTTPGLPGVTLAHSRTSWRDSQPLPDFQEGLLTTHGLPGGPPDH